VYFFLANGVEVPPDHVCRGLVCPAVDAEGHSIDRRDITRGLFDVHVASGLCCPKNAYLAVRYRDYWYYIDDHDQASKDTFALVLQLSRLDFGHQRPVGPLLTLPVGK
jgi:hypothetical protein